MKLVIFGLSISSSWGNGHATLWRGLCRALIDRGHDVTFFERDVPYYAAHRDLPELSGGRLVLYSDWESIRGKAQSSIASADVALTTSYCPDAIAAGQLILESRALRVFYDLDTPVTLAQLAEGKPVDYLGDTNLAEYDLILSYTGGAALEHLQSRLGARRVAPLYGSVDPTQHRPVAPAAEYRAALSYLGTYADDRQAALERLFVQPARRRTDLRFLIGGAQYPESFPWVENIFFVQHLPPPSHPAFFCSSRLTLNVTRRPMAEMGYCPSGRLFEAAACGVPILTDTWEGMEQFFEPGREILIAQNSCDVLEALELSDAELKAIAMAARERTLATHTAANRAAELEQILDEALAEPCPAWQMCG